MLPAQDNSIDRALSFIEGEPFSMVSSSVLNKAETGPAFTANLVSLVMEFWNAPDTSPGAVMVEQLTSAGGNFIITDANTWEHYAPQQLFADLPVGEYVWYKRFTDADGFVHTLQEGTIRKRAR